MSEILLAAVQRGVGSRQNRTEFQELQAVESILSVLN